MAENPWTAPAQGTLDEGRALLGRRSPVNFGSHPVSAARIAQYCAQIEDGNPSYWDAAESARIWGRPIAPPGMLQAWTFSPPWLPDRQVELDFMMMKLPLPGTSIVNFSTETLFHRPIYVGETINFFDMATDISPEKQTRLGSGHFVTTVATYQNERGEAVATVTNVHFRFTPKETA